MQTVYHSPSHEWLLYLSSQPGVFWVEIRDGRLVAVHQPIEVVNA
jgi:hypothetical protein